MSTATTTDQAAPTAVRDAAGDDGAPRSGATAPPGARRARPARDPFFDNAKFLLIVLVVIGHNWFPLIAHSRDVKAAYLVVYSFHMPAFILLSGYFSRSFDARPQQVRKLVKSVLVPYFIFQVVYLYVVARTDRTSFTFDLTAPSYLCWFLLALFVWRLSTPVWRALRHPVAVAAVVSVCAGLMNATWDFSLGRILQFLPWFVLGLVLRPEHFTRLRARPVRIAAGVVMLAALPIAYLMAPGTNADWLDMEYGVNHFAGTGDLRYIAVRLALFAVSAVLAAAALALVPGRRVWFTALGALTMYPYLLHGLVVKVAERLGVHSAAAAGGPLAALALTAGAVCLALLLTTPPVRAVARWAVEPRMPHPRRAPAPGR
ncbi:acyltransferase family protein [Streptomyces sp. SL13]|uniref:Acyltransferase family protein n=1 Tax=Streptantibioticus silvisoli TaxID=2705255 RepID=A0AA90KAV7_9ACTN|nr:acyltransferase family protein [Streptantibioticus silvisoli]MDI5965967.1 acyltransferase family protein [Streptantibioticus silvisoli]MDI5972552.1 acyltransferase family protein [Streptantibioticus silvisoli]